MTFRVRGQPQENMRLRQMILFSAVLHAVVITWVIVGGYVTRSSQPRSMAYTVELVNPAALGTNLPGGGKDGGRAEAAPGASSKPVPPSPSPQPIAKPPVPVVQKEPIKSPPAQQKEVVKIAEKEKPVEPPTKPAPEKIKVEAKKSETKPELKKTEVKSEPEKTLPKKPEEKKPEPKPTEAKPQKAEVKPEKPTPKSGTEAAKPEPQKPPVKTVEKTSEEKATKDPAQPEDRDRQIAAALERVKARVQPKGEIERDSEGAKGAGPVTKGGDAGLGGGGEVRGIEFILYTQQLQRRVQESWIVAEKKPGLLAAVSFKIQTDGDVQEVELMKSSGDNTFDQSVLRAVRKAAPFPPPPQTYTQEFTTQKIVMNFGGEGRVN
jgi:colicin import membrane protein